MARDYLKEYSGHCLTCKKYDIYSRSDATVRGYRCVHHHRPMAMDERCPNHILDYARSNSQIESAVEWIGRRGYDPRPDAGSCYITTIVCKILGLPDDCAYLTEFRKLRDNYMVHTEEGLRLLYSYDTWGVKVANALEALYENSPEYATNVVKMVIEPCYLINIMGYLKFGHYEQAILQYILMSERIGNIVGVRFDVPEVDVSSLDPKTVGHGRVRKIEG